MSGTVSVAAHNSAASQSQASQSRRAWLSNLQKAVRVLGVCFDRGHCGAPKPRPLGHAPADTAPVALQGRDLFTTESVSLHIATVLA